MITLKSLIPEADDALALEAEELAGALLMYLNSHGESSGTGSVFFGKINQYNFFNNLHHHPEYGDRQPEVNRALMEAWAWLESEGFLIRDADQTAHTFFISRRGKRVGSREGFSAYCKGRLLPKGHLHPLVAGKVYPAFLRGEYDTAVFQAFREVEIAVRSAGNYSDDTVGKELMRNAFRPVSTKPGVSAGPLTDQSLPVSEQESMRDLFAGAIGLYKNPQSHRNVPTEALTAAEVIVFASHLLRMIDELVSH